jgi:restriction endonuclease Mrr
MNYWLHRISYHAEVSYPLLDKNILSIGFSDFANQEFIDDVLKDDEWKKRWTVLENKFKTVWGSRPRTRHNLWRFVDGFKKGDRIVVPSWGVFSVYELVSEKPKPIGNLKIENLKDWNKKSLTMKNGLLYREDKRIDLGFYWVVKPIAKKMSRKDFADARLTSRMKIRTTNTNIFNIKESVEKALISFKNEKPINLYSEILDKIAPQVLKSLKTELNPDKFEKLVKFYFQKNGASEVSIPAKNEKGKEGDADVIAVFEPLKIIIYAQVKFHNIKSETNQWAVQQIKDYRNNKETMDDDYTKIAWVITSANGFTKECIRIAQEEKVHLIDGKRFAEMIIEAGISDLNRTL